MILPVELFGIIGIVFEIIGFILMIRFWADPYNRHVEEWKKFQKILHPKDYRERIQDDFNYWRQHKDKDKPDSTNEWMVPERFAGYWRTEDTSILGHCRWFDITNSTNDIGLELYQFQIESKP